VKIDLIGYHSSVEDFVAAVDTAAEQGFGTYWLTWSHGMDPLVAISVAAREVPRIRFGTSVVPNIVMHPLPLAMAAMTTNQVADGRLTLGIGASHEPTVDNRYYVPWTPPVRRMREYLDALLPLVREGSVDVRGELIGCTVELGIKAPPPSVMIAALGPKMLKLAGTVADGTITWMTGPKTLATHTVPTITAAAVAAGRPAPEVVSAVSVCVTDDAASAYERIAKQNDGYGLKPSYRAMLDREGLDNPADLAVIGSPARVEERLRAIFDAGATRIIGSEIGGPDEQAATRETLASLLD
jgi:F420-dependent oxidoreductase-like protein